MAFQVRPDVGASCPTVQNFWAMCLKFQADSLREPRTCQRRQQEPLLAGPAGRRCCRGRWDRTNAAAPRAAPRERSPATTTCLPGADGTMPPKQHGVSPGMAWLTGAPRAPAALSQASDGRAAWGVMDSGNFKLTKTPALCSC